jgi:hypothetical protein
MPTAETVASAAAGLGITVAKEEAAADTKAATQPILDKAAIATTLALIKLF